MWGGPARKKEDSPPGETAFSHKIRKKKKPVKSLSLTRRKEGEKTWKKKSASDLVDAGKARSQGGSSLSWEEVPQERWTGGPSQRENKPRSTHIAGESSTSEKWSCFLTSERGRRNSLISSGEKQAQSLPESGQCHQRSQEGSSEPCWKEKTALP